MEIISKKLQIVSGDGSVAISCRNPAQKQLNACSHTFEEFFVGRVLFEEFEKSVHGPLGFVVGQDTPERGQAASIVVAVELGFFSGAAGRDVDGRENSCLGQTAVEDNLAVAGAFEFLEYKLVHSRAGINKASRDNCGRAPVFDVASQSEESAWHFEDAGFQSAGHGLTAWCASPADSVVESPAHSCQAVDEQNNFSTTFQLCLYVGKHQLGELRVLVGTMVACAGNNFCPFHRATEVSNFLGPLINKQHNDAAFGRTVSNRLDDLFQQNGLSRLGRRDYQLTCALADWRDEVHDPHALLAIRAQVESFVRIDSHQVGKPGAFVEEFRLHAAHRFDGNQFSFAFLSLELTGYDYSFSQGMLTNQVRMNHHFSRPRPVRTLGRSQRELLFMDTF